ncbi:MAG TPA: hypothetical protein DD728_11175 [Hyphomonas atlantica]|uniref:Uncharacterized protein n=1 Tax=Hyphomonas atlantica TaxID=1280948 RepID=A0A356W6W2_9PROT|nr:hypothetical protein [Hyphomonas atlantica]
MGFEVPGPQSHMLHAKANAGGGDRTVRQNGNYSTYNGLHADCVRRQFEGTQAAPLARTATAWPRLCEI